ncbi:MFS transporter [Sulfolobales archaeon HS-7]|nr:MFS transporter [Sulfolobales archaeon HS-7]
MDRGNIVIFVVLLGTMMSAIDTTIVILALPTIVQSLHSNLFTIIWVILLYILVVAVLTTQLGRLGDSYGRSRMYNIGFLIFTIGSAMCGAAPTDVFLIGSRGIQAIGASLMQANGGAIIADNYPPNRRGRAYGYTSIGWNVGAVLGILLGGIITTFIGWRYIFYINVPIGVVTIALGVRTLRDSQHVKKKIDIPGVILLGASLTLIAYGASEIAGIGLTLLNAIYVALGVLLLVPFTLVELRTENPLIDFAAFKNRVLSSSLLASFLQSTGYLATAFILIMYLQGIRGLSPFNASLLLVPGYVLASVVAPFTGRLSDRIGARIPATLGMVMMIVATFLYTRLGLHTPYDYVILTTLIGGVGSSLFYPANNSAVMANASRGYYGGISGVLRTLSNIGTLLSYVVTITVASLAVPRYVAFEVFLGTSNLVGGVGAKFLAGIHVAFFISMAILVVGAVLSALRGKEVRSVQERQISPATEPG